MRTGINVVVALMIIVSFFMAIPLHEWAHAQMAAWLGDRTPRLEGRQTLNPRVHIDPVGTLLCVVLAFQSLSGMGWGKPVKPDPWKMKVGANTGVLIVACAGPIFSLVVGLVTAGLARLFAPVFILHDNFFFERVLQFLIVFACVNIGIALLNLLPFHPLDGYQIVHALLPSKQAVQFARSAVYGPFIILILFFIVPFIASLVGLGWFPLFNLAYYIQWVSINVVAMMFGLPFQTIANFYGF
ncbi:site-2 protease family protein [Tengunoibacter tsumagoiensis]|uniref:Peptidase n=1 Tax=Tengunoibacter tsumagoiensis TaxID=2014871 RepID=A0A401ZTZ5_9CHLR|nr:site-2 protease family protein [Tengunoibacter tsumagoiensis]GCE10398.1 peptidase [Tengunoibacter tsumagoiensis]